MLNGIMNVIVEEGLYDTQYIQAHTEGFERLREHLKAFPPEKMAEICGIPAETLRTVARTFARAERAHRLLGHGRLAAHPRHRQCPLPDLARDDVRPCRQARDRTAPVARAEQRPGCLGRGPDPDGLPGLSQRQGHRLSQPPGGALGHAARRQAGPHRGRDRGRDPRGPSQSHVHHGREPRDVGPRRQPCAGGPGEARASGRPGHLPDRDGDVRRRGAAGFGLAREGRHRHQHQPHGADGPARRCRCRATRARTGGSPRSWPAGWGSPGAMPARPTCSPR